jgi:Fe-S-cluster containining protein
LVNQAIARGAAAAHATVSCKDCYRQGHEKGCCRVAFLVGLSEAIPIAIALRETGRDTPELRARLLAVGDQIDADFLTEDGSDTTFARYQPCVFLENEQCSIYPHRPSACAGYAVVSPPRNCCGPDPRPTAIVDTRAICTEVLLGAIAEFRRRLPGQRTLYLASLPRAVGLLLAAWDRHDYVEFLAQQAWLDIAEVTPFPSSTRARAFGQPPLVPLRVPSRSSR